LSNEINNRVFKIAFNAFRYINAFLICGPKAFSQQDKSTAKWFEAKEWLNGLSLVPSASIDQQELKKQYEAKSEWWKSAFNYLKETNLADLKPGKYVIDGDNVFAWFQKARPGPGIQPNGRTTSSTSTSTM
jgi:hypothetical protein